jgi:hypothetical protein
MTNYLVIRSALAHDGDGVVRIDLQACSDAFRGSTSVWGSPECIAGLAAKLEGFPQRGETKVTYSFGTEGTGTCALDFFQLDAIGHIAVAVAMVAPYAFRQTKRFESADLFIRIEPSAVDRFVSSLKAFKEHTQNEATLVGVDEYERGDPGTAI